MSKISLMSEYFNHSGEKNRSEEQLVLIKIHWYLTSIFETVCFLKLGRIFDPTYLKVNSETVFKNLQSVGCASLCSKGEVILKKNIYRISLNKVRGH